ncbi:hypothetical protein FQ330_02185 [Agrococcus sediminis]|uniref:Uncharacterized protein n=1 Tax=Agrococcus sediminis TaxID=2599924 RepID=A0A5M8QM47_9MICO|nr:hypothetical protein [Agrococcus sediminis]KAA6436241.1 hypothetical protein FQ330_02185 [Agrococcus sediminis]
MRSAHHTPDAHGHDGHDCPRAADRGHHRHHGHPGHRDHVDAERSHCAERGHHGHDAADQHRTDHAGAEPQTGRHPRGDARPRPTLERSILRSARRIRRAGLTPDQLHDRLAGAVSHADYVTTMRTLRRIGAELR